MNDKELKLLLIGLMFLSIVLICMSFFSPWWKVKTSKETQIRSNSSIEADYWLFQTITVTLTTKNTTKTVTASFSNLTDNGNVEPLTPIFTVSLILNAIGLGLTLIVIILYILLTLGKVSYVHQRKILSIGYIAALMPLVSSWYMAVEFPLAVSKVSILVPLKSDVEIALSPQNVTFFWGSIQIKGAELSEWIWGAGLGWLSSFAASIILLPVLQVSRNLLKRSHESTKS